MNQVRRTTKTNSYGVMDAVNTLLGLVDGYTVKSWAMFAGTIIVVGQQGDEHGVTVWTDGADFFATPDWMLDWADGEWSGLSANGQYFTINNCEPMVEVE